ncbi:peptidoglycan-recognition protein LF [Ceratitis capitata]|uniref:(Mediterranean fruit fly) hypothetical protein n=1 Tax=Ceratitis capitata TaxID=7213 RepID=A0A811UZY6_CERCA|nr:peptidoglycan-recognition protein LF [Ceratitis capitata]CAD7003635.1 unnamed protein product [Ceratitis capitata]
MSICGSCNKTIDLCSLVKTVKCNGPCQGEFHSNCTSLKHQKLQTNKNVIWLCENCYNLCAKNVPDQAVWNNLQEKENNQVTISLTYLCDVEKRLGALEKKSSQDLTEVETNGTRSNNSPAQSKIPNKSKFNRGMLFIIGLIAFLILTLAITLFIVRGASRKPITAPRNYKFNGTLLRITKEEWFAEAERDSLKKLELPVQRVIIGHTATNGCENKTQCDGRVQSLQAFHIYSNGWNDIGYNFLVGGDGLVYEGRGWYNMGAYTKDYNRDSISIAFIGTFNMELPSENDLIAAQLLIDEGLRLGALSKDYRLYGARQLSPTESPGKALYSVITKWPHWAKNI